MAGIAAVPMTWLLAAICLSNSSSIQSRRTSIRRETHEEAMLETTAAMAGVSALMCTPSLTGSLCGWPLL